jgi:hypothetical protein
MGPQPTKRCGSFCLNIVWETVLPSDGPPLRPSLVELYAGKSRSASQSVYLYSALRPAKA